MSIDGPLGNVCIGQDATVRQALETIDRGASAIALVTDESGKLQGVLTDGDIRRGLLKGAQLDGLVHEFANRAPHVVGPDATRASVLDLMRSLRISEVPVVDDAGRLVGLHTLNDIVGRTSLSNIAVIMAGGKGTRLGALTKDTPKPLMTVADRTIIEWIILGLVESGVTNIYVSVAYLAEKIMAHLGDGSRLGCTIKYLHEDPAKPLNTAGALGLLHHERPDISEPVLVTNADLMVRYSAAELLAFHAAKNASVTVAARPYTHQVPFGVLEIGEGRSISAVVEKPTIEFEISTGIYAVSPEALALVPYLEPFSMPELVQACIEQSRTVSAWPIESDWIDVGTPKDLATAKGQ
ncbi:sugar phosphate nucleotidyltransferase [Arthrobacter globiformis]|uniref:sugar phosphate nucleotidyltransferase n=1 Tax=Arthrobacter globiformis TaxID=1665 RepID=UPI00278CA8C7|nr:sugar phosphate nucleotidyltransferase [Arthrobacter globiformis]MDQ0619535.1 dTDP-glucose pyrophosphorylase [Arthrobacter globiformis]